MSSTMALHGAVLLVGTLPCATRRSSSSSAAPCSSWGSRAFPALGKGTAAVLWAAFQHCRKDLHLLWLTRHVARKITEPTWPDELASVGVTSQLLKHLVEYLSPSFSGRQSYHGTGWGGTSLGNCMGCKLTLETSSGQPCPTSRKPEMELTL